MWTSAPCSSMIGYFFALLRHKCAQSLAVSDIWEAVSDAAQKSASAFIEQASEYPLNRRLLPKKKVEQSSESRMIGDLSRNKSSCWCVHYLRRKETEIRQWATSVCSFLESTTGDPIPFMSAKRCEEWAGRKCVTGVLPEKGDNFGHQTTALTAGSQTRIFKRYFNVN